MGPDYEKYLDRLKGIDLEVSDSALQHLSRVMKKDLWEPAGVEEIRNAKEWLHNPVRNKIQRVFALILANSVGEYFIELSKRHVEKIDGNDGFYKWDVGFFHLPEDLITSSLKIRSMRVGAETELQSPFHHTSFNNIQSDKRILPSGFVRFLRRSGLDGLTEVVYGVSSNEWSIFGTRPYNSYELEGTRILYNMRFDSSLSLSEKAQDILSIYPDKVGFFKPLPGIFGPLAAFDTKVSHLTRMAGDIAYWERASFPVDFRLFAEGFRQRIIRGVSAK